MINFRIKHLFIFLVMTFSLTCAPIYKEAQALFDPGSMVSQVPNTIQSFASKVTTYANKVIKTTLQIYKSIEDFFKNLFSRKNSGVPGTKKIKKSTVANIEDENSIREVFPKLFFQYPSNDPTQKHKYEAEGQEFYEDTFIEAFTAVRELEKQLGEMDIKIAEAKTQYTQADSLNKGLNNNIMINMTMDQVLTIVQELVAIKAQLVAAKAVQGEVKPLYMGDDEAGVDFDSK